ncbi:hypothetical protein G7Y89_g6334 [Cudoniella acicularis]|uniref:Uncharacterized protein n=1 Tax=Cudoniella acicularis TaxID=354080 RepID=A0A8H4W5M1_9HELO|nr:hypothetical protein G7Y89_g6334 [Cudoniella acicularis]
MADIKPEFRSDFEEFETPDVGNTKTARTVESVRTGLTLLALCSAIVIVGTSGETLATFNSTQLGDEYLLPSLWPSEFDLRPTTALVACGAIVIVSSAISLAVSIVPAARNKALIHLSISYLCPVIALAAGLIGTSFFYGVNSSNTVSSLQSWSCQWSAIDMDVKPYWGTLCKESKVALYLTVMMIPLQIIILGTLAWGALAGKKQPVIHERKGSPAMS